MKFTWRNSLVGVFKPPRGLKRVHPDQIKGELVGITASDEDEAPDFNEVPVWVDPDGDPDLESFVVIERNEDVLQYGRLSSGYEASERADPRRQQRDRSFNFDSREIRESNMAPDVVRVLRVDLLGEVDFSGDRVNVKRPSKLPRVGQSVYEMGASELPELLEIPGPEDEYGLNIGAFESGGESIDFKLDPKFMSRHVAILGRTGVGKTYTGHVIIEELINYDGVQRALDDPNVSLDDVRGVPVVTFDMEDDVRPMAEDVGGITLYPNGPGMDIPFQLIGWNEFNRFLGDMPTDKQKQVIGSAYARIRQKALDELGNQGAINTGKTEFAEAIRDSADYHEYSYEDAAVSRALTVINSSAVLSDSMNNWARLMADHPIVNIDVSQLGDAERGAVISATSRMLQLLREREEIPPFVLAIDEAHEFVPSGVSGESTEVVRDLVKTARHIGVGVMLMTQSPSELDSKTLRTCNTYITLALASNEVKEIEGLLSDLSKRTLEQIPNMEQGRAFVGTARDIMLHTFPVDVRERKSPDGAETPHLVEDSQHWFDNNNPEDWSDLEESQTEVF